MIDGVESVVNSSKFRLLSATAINRSMKVRIPKIMTSSDIVTLCHTHERSYDRERTRALARQQWAKVMDCDAKVTALEKLRADIIKAESQERSSPSLVKEIGKNITCELCGNIGHIASVCPTNHPTNHPTNQV